MTTASLKKPTFLRTLLAGFMAGTVGAILSNLANGLYLAAGGRIFSDLTFVSITMAALVTNVLGALVYFTLQQRTARPERNFRLAAAGLVVLGSLYPLFGAGLGASFFWLTLALHLLVAVPAVVLVPRLSRG